MTRDALATTLGQQTSVSSRLTASARRSRRRSDQNLDIAGGEASRAYVLFTSGSTGEPKAVAVPHRAIVRLAYGMPEIPIGPGTRVLQAAPLAFDASTFRDLGAAGSRRHDRARRSRYLYAARARTADHAHDVTVLWLTASLFNLIVDERPEALARARYVITGGEALSVSHVERALAALPSTTLVNGYGPTEAIDVQHLSRHSSRRSALSVDPRLDGRSQIHAFTCSTKKSVRCPKDFPVSSGSAETVWPTAISRMSR